MRKLKRNETAAATQVGYRRFATDAVHRVGRWFRPIRTKGGKRIAASIPKSISNTVTPPCAPRMKRPPTAMISQ